MNIEKNLEEIRGALPGCLVKRGAKCISVYNVGTLFFAEVEGGGFTLAEVIGDIKETYKQEISILAYDAKNGWATFVGKEEDVLYLKEIFPGSVVPKDSRDNNRAERDEAFIWQVLAGGKRDLKSLPPLHEIVEAIQPAQ